MKTIRRNFIKAFFGYFPIVLFTSTTSLFYFKKKRKLKKNKNLIWHLSVND